MTARVLAYNAHVQTKATQLDFAYLNPNPAIDNLKTTGCLRDVPDLTSTTAPFGACVSLDGIHPSTSGQVAFANLIIGAINTKYPEAALPAVP